MTVVLVAFGGAVGAGLRFLADHWVRGRHASAFPWGTLAVNVVGSLVLGVLCGAALFGIRLPVAQALIGAGFCGALTTYSTFGYETVRLLADGRGWWSVANVAVTVFAGLGAGACGVMVAASLWG